MNAKNSEDMYFTDGKIIFHGNFHGEKYIWTKCGQISIGRKVEALVRIFNQEFSQQKH